MKIRAGVETDPKEPQTLVNKKNDSYHVQVGKTGYFCAMKYRFTAMLLVFCILSSSFSRVLVYAGFELNRKYIAEHLCINRDKPWMHCNGHCYLAKKLKQADEKQAANERETQKSLVQEVFFEKPAQVKFFTRVIGVMLIPTKRIQLPDGHGSIFQPPQLG
ncbi:MAG TPA: hypothetical protein VHE59_15675 [Mucilaginibacter sp.]|nr:hypothetical protein [Mucilaginibacter sp.]